MATLQTLLLAGQRFVVLPEAEYKRLAEKSPEPMLPLPDADGNYPAVETMRAMLCERSSAADGRWGFPRWNWPAVPASALKP